ncbi:MAG: SRPBCC family protein [Aestuariivirga sp.]|uniref:SRPBCC family protein n=1 Tax=Aestuariivirga sp. TaxID=2650926 RepID=UPI0025B7ADBB|nr:SRPBCC family protein [Aestuariivirga sp.]MCA3560615.1 SRPBCC family protein [Aestuariivirga sp.]
MKSVIKVIVFVVMTLTVIFYGGAYMLPGEARVERSAVIAAPPEKVYAIVADLRRWPEWSPWIETDPKTAFSFEGPAEGAGQVMRWSSNNPMVGSGTLRVTAATPDVRVAMASGYTGFGTSTAIMDIVPDDAGTRVTWVFQSALPGVVDRWAGLGIDRTVGAEYERGLAKLKTLAETPLR